MYERLNPVVDFNDRSEGSRDVRHLQVGVEDILNFQKGPTEDGFWGSRLFLIVDFLGVVKYRADSCRCKLSRLDHMPEINLRSYEVC